MQPSQRLIFIRQCHTVKEKFTLGYTLNRCPSPFCDAVQRLFSFEGGWFSFSAAMLLTQTTTVHAWQVHIYGLKPSEAGEIGFFAFLGMVFSPFAWCKLMAFSDLGIEQKGFFYRDKRLLYDIFNGNKRITPSDQHCGISNPFCCEEQPYTVWNLCVFWPLVGWRLQAPLQPQRVETFETVRSWSAVWIFPLMTNTRNVCAQSDIAMLVLSLQQHN